MTLTLGLSQGMTGVTLPIVTLTLSLSRGLNGVSGRLGISGGGGVGPLDMPRTPYRTSKGKRSQ